MCVVVYSYVIVLNMQMPKEKMTVYMRQYRNRERDRIAVENATHTFLFNELLNLVKTKYSLSDVEQKIILESIYDLIEAYIPHIKNKNVVASAYLAVYLRHNLIPVILEGYKHPSLVRDMNKFLLNLENTELNRMRKKYID